MNDLKVMNDLVTIAVCTLPFVFVIAIVWLQNNEKHKLRQLQAELYIKALENGQPVPADLFKEDKKQYKPLNTGIILIAVSIGIISCLWLFFSAIAQTNPEATGLSWIASVGLIPLQAGIAFVIIHFIEKKKTANKDA